MEWVYFGCHKVPGHFTWSSGMQRLVRRYGSRDFTRFDGMLPLQINTAPYIATVSRLGGWGMTALAWWDRSVDYRDGGNSIIFAPVPDIRPEDLLAEAQVRFPEVFKRLPQPLVLL